MKAGPPFAPPDEPDPVLGNAIRRLREERKLSLAELAERSEVAIGELSQIEGGLIDPPWATVERIARALGVSMKQLASEVVEQERGGEAS